MGNVVDVRVRFIVAVDQIQARSKRLPAQEQTFV
jgi:hypothetical protein